MANVIFHAFALLFSWFGLAWFVYLRSLFTSSFTTTITMLESQRPLIVPRVQPFRSCKRRATEHRQLHLLDDLSTGLLGHLLRYLDVASLAQTAATCRTLRRFILQEETWHDIAGESSLWRVVDFGLVPTAARLTDEQLAALLQQCRARERTQILRLTGCTALTGVGLEPLRGSHVLREADLWLDKTTRVGPVELDLDVVLPLLNSMPPMTVTPEMNLPQNSSTPSVLSLVKMRPQRRDANLHECFDDRVSDWFAEYHEALEADCRNRNIYCGHCQDSFVSIRSVEVFSYAYCQECEQYSCWGPGGRGCKFTNRCRRCHLQSCLFSDRCAKNVEFLNCAVCNIIFCEDCTDFGADMFCENFENCLHVYCPPCSDVCEPCGECEKTFCPDCIEEHEENCTAGNYESDKESSRMGDEESSSMDTATILSLFF